jgi:hypothetical protein
MALITTPGAVDADSYVEVAAFKTYAENIGYDISDKTDPEIEQSLRRGTRWLDAVYGPRFAGKPTSVMQALEWPRIGAMWRGSELPDDIIPSQVNNAACEAAWRELTMPGSLSPDYVAAERIKQEQVGELSVTYMDTTGGASDVQPVISVIDGILAGLLTARSSVLFGSAARA